MCSLCQHLRAGSAQRLVQSLAATWDTRLRSMITSAPLRGACSSEPLLGVGAVMVVVVLLQCCTSPVPLDAAWALYRNSTGAST